MDCPTFTVNGYGSPIGPHSTVFGRTKLKTFHRACANSSWDISMHQDKDYAWPQRSKSRSQPDVRQSHGSCLVWTSAVDFTCSFFIRAALNKGWALTHLLDIFMWASALLQCSPCRSYNSGSMWFFIRARNVWKRGMITCYGPELAGTWAGIRNRNTHLLSASCILM